MDNEVQKPTYTTHPTVVAAATIVGVTSAIGFVLAIGLVLFGTGLNGDQGFILVIGAFVLGYLLWWMVRSEITKEIEGSD